MRLRFFLKSPSLGLLVRYQSLESRLLSVSVLNQSKFRYLLLKSFDLVPPPFCLSISFPSPPWFVEGWKKSGSFHGCFQVAREVNRTAPQVLIRYCFQMGLSVVVRGTSPTNMDQNYQSIDFMLTDDHLKTLDTSALFFFLFFLIGTAGSSRLFWVEVGSSLYYRYFPKRNYFLTRAYYSF